MFQTFLAVIVLSLIISNGNLYEAKLLYGQNHEVNVGRMQTRSINPTPEENQEVIIIK